MDMSNIKRQATLVSMLLGISSSIYFLASMTTVPIRFTVTTPSWEILVEIRPYKFPSRPNFLQDTAEVPRNTNN